MGTQRRQKEVVLPWLVRCTSRADTVDFCPALAALVSPVQNIILLTVLFFTLLVPEVQQPGHVGVLGRLSMCLWLQFWHCQTPIHSARSHPHKKIVSAEKFAHHRKLRATHCAK